MLTVLQPLPIPSSRPPTAPTRPSPAGISYRRDQVGEAEHLTIQEMLGEGTFGKVYKGELSQGLRGGPCDGTACHPAASPFLHTCYADAGAHTLKALTLNTHIQVFIAFYSREHTVVCPAWAGGAPDTAGVILFQLKSSQRISSLQPEPASIFAPNCRTCHLRRPLLIPAC